MRNQYDIIVSGGGLVGSILALAAAREKLNILVFDSVKPSRIPPFNGRAYALSLSSCRLLAALELKEFIETHSQDIHSIHISDGLSRASSPSLRFESSEIDVGPMARMVEDRHLRSVVKREIQNHANFIRVINTRITELELNAFGVKVKDTNGRSYRASMVAGCDGRDSIVARKAAIRFSQYNYAQSAIACAVEHERDHHGCARQIFLPSGPLAILPLQGRVSSLVWTVGQDEASRLEKMNHHEFLKQLRIPMGSILGDLSLVGDRFFFPLTQRIAKTLVTERAALVGESAHIIHPLAGQSLNLGFRDAASLAQILGSAARRGEDIGLKTVLERYQRWRRFDVNLFAFATDSFDWLYSNSNPILYTLRKGGMDAVKRLPALRGVFIREAAGLNGQLPKIMMG